MIEGAVVLGLFFLLLFLKIPLAFSMVGSSFLSILIFGLGPWSTISTSLFNGVYSSTMLALPYFIFAGNVMTRGGIAKKLCDMVGTIFRRFTGGSGMVAVVASAFFAAISGSAAATTASIGSMMVPEMTKEGYKEEFALSIAAAGGVIGPIIPPSVVFVLYGVATDTSISDLFIGGILPGFVLTAVLCASVYLMARRAGIQKIESEKFSLKAFLRAVWNAKYAVMVPVIILGGIYGGIMTATEAGAVSCIYAIIITLFVDRTLTFKGLLKCASESAITSATLLLLVGTAKTLSRVLTLMQVPQMIASTIVEVSDSKFLILLLINLLLLAMGCVMSTSAAIAILAPLCAPIINAYGIDPIHFGVIICINTSIGAITPPVGTCLFAASLIGETPYHKICKAIIPFVFVELFVLIIINAVPSLSTALVTLLT